MLYVKLLYLLEKAENEKAWYIKLLEKIGTEIKQFGREIGDFFGMIKRNTFDKLVEAFGETGVLIAFFTIIIILTMVIITGVIRGKE